MSKPKPIAYKTFDDNGRKVIVKCYAPHDAYQGARTFTVKSYGLAGRVSSCTVVANAYKRFV